MRRRNFIKNTMLGALTPTFLSNQSLWAMGNVDQKLLENENVLVVIQLNGGNDGLNTVIPINQYGNYKNARSNIALVENKILKIPQSDLIGLHPSLKNLASLMSEGKGNIIQDVGYPNPNFSHFRATDIWHTASNSNEVLESGWAGRLLALDHPNYPEGYPSSKYPDPLSIQIGSVVSTALQGPLYSMGMSISDTTNFYNLIENADEPVPNTLAGKELDYLRQVSKQTNKYSETIKAAALKVSQQKTYPNLSLASQLKIVARLIAGGLKTKIYYVNLGGFDTHSGQVVTTDTSTGTHANLMANLGDSIKAFQDDLKFLGVADRVLGMTYSEFGRRIKSNASSGTDHGAAAPMFFFGEKVNPTYFGKPTTISANVGNNDNIPMQHDFRSVYASIMKYWFCSDSVEMKSVLFRDFATIPLVNGSVCGYVTSTEPELTNARLKAYPNPVQDILNLRFISDGGQNSFQLLDMRGIEVIPEIDEEREAGSQEITLNISHLNSGIYLARFRNNDYQEVVRVLKK
ncbi:DUF1501 domain-containing protein [Lacihabitans soyangensis]|uniref:DUF1501 domain-containing protein n=1 Tax=Lacihabitans soyangensis TaxID=869394 RepID=A0AAE3KWR2_9BACT|nr:DUF1501 domain-containing protein [Lacihabitans soyangensis]MCP9763315.1 DUF1501 domain-containing protein [Lacihabitans soyangensis]